VGLDWVLAVPRDGWQRAAAGFELRDSYARLLQLALELRRPRRRAGVLVPGDGLQLSDSPLQLHAAQAGRIKRRFCCGPVSFQPLELKLMLLRRSRDRRRRRSQLRQRRLSCRQWYSHRRRSHRRRRHTIAAASLRDVANGVAVFGLQQPAMLGGETESDRRPDREAQPDEYLAELSSASLLLSQSSGKLLLGQDAAADEDRAKRNPLAQSVQEIVRVCRHESPPLRSVSGALAAGKTVLFHLKPFAAESTKISE
jgi:hypothetical protein